VFLVLVTTLVALNDAVLDGQKLDLDPPCGLFLLHCPVMEVRVEAPQAAMDEKKLIQLLVHKSGKLPLIGLLQPSERGTGSRGESGHEARFLFRLFQQLGKIDDFRLESGRPWLRVFHLVHAFHGVMTGSSAQETSQPAGCRSAILKKEQALVFLEGRASGCELLV